MLSSSLTWMNNSFHLQSGKIADISPLLNPFSTGNGGYEEPDEWTDQRGGRC